MPTYTWTRTREQVRDAALRKIGVLGEGQTAGANASAVAFEALDARLKELHKLGVLWWNVSGAQTTLSLAAGTATVSLSAVTDFLFPVSLMFVSGTDQQPIDIIGHREYQAIPNKTQQGEPEQAYFAGGSVYFWPVPSTNGSAKLTYQAIAEDSASNTRPDVPVEMLRSLSIVLAHDVMDDFGIADIRPATAQRIASQLPDALASIRALNAQKVGNTTITPDYY
jgi:hypothetical protein